MLNRPHSSRHRLLCGEHNFTPRQATRPPLRPRHPAFATGTFKELGGSNPSVLAYLREEDDDLVFCVNNLSRFSQPIELYLQHWNGYVPVELTGNVEFPRIGHLPYLLTLPGHGFYWFQLRVSEEMQ